jgi:deoxyribodipyrimidine photo-lyase
MTTHTSIWWIRRDLRLTDNTALDAALKHSTCVIPLFILDDALLDSRYAAEKRIAFLFDGLRALDQELRARGSRLIVRRGRPVSELCKLVEEAGPNRIFAEHDFSPYAKSRDEEISSKLPLTMVSQPTVTHPDDVLKKDGTPYTVFTPYSRQWKTAIDHPLELIEPPERLSPPDVKSDIIPDLPALPETVPFIAGADAGESRLREFTEGDSAPVYEYTRNRDRLDLDGTARLSPYLRFGMISARQAIKEAMHAIDRSDSRTSRESAESWLNELIWREFYTAILHHFPHVRTLEFQEKYRDLGWINDDDDLLAWKNARTGYPIVDACMRQLHTQGWMHNRGRMITASFLVKHLLVDWRVGEEHFMQHLLDGDPASNNGGWQWTAGTGTDAAPYFRVFNPITQSKRHDPEGSFIRKWLPELSSVPDEYIHEPRKMPEDVQESSGCMIGRDYPEPVIDHSFARQRALEAYKRS